MKLKFNKDENENITVKFEHDNKEYAFNYVNMIKVLYHKKYTFDEPEFLGEISEIEKVKIKEMILLMNNSVVTKE